MSCSLTIDSMKSSAAGSGDAVDERHPGVLRVDEVLADLIRVVLHRDRAAAHDRDARGLDLRAQRARGLGRIGARDVHVLEGHVRHAQRLGHLERLVERELAQRVGRHAEHQRLAGRGGAAASADRPARPARTGAAAAAATVPTKARRETSVLISFLRRLGEVRGMRVLRSRNSPILHARPGGRQPTPAPSAADS